MLNIAHISDIHIRGLSRHDEYREVFKKFCEECAEHKVDDVFIGGDTWHTKTSGISPEYIDLFSWFLKELVKISRIHIILGNHDLNLSNLSRQDAITPIVKAIDHPDIFLYRNSGVYEFRPGFNWCVFSLLDKENWENVKPVPGKINIACFHGSVRGAFTESNWEIEEGLKTSFFDGYDFVMLGDIHKKQFLDFRDVEIIVTEDELKNYSQYEIIEEYK